MTENGGGGNQWWAWYAARETPYQVWQKTEGIPIIRGSYVADLHDVEVQPWTRVGQRGAYVNLADQEHDDAYVLEIAPGGQTEPQHHLFEALVYVLEGRGTTTVWNPGGTKQTVEWEKGSVFSPPLNCHYQHFNVDGREPARLWAVTSAPMAINMYRDAEFIFNCPYAFASRYGGQAGYFSDPGSKYDRHWTTNYIADARSFPLDRSPYRGGGTLVTNFSLAGNAMAVHISEFPPATYARAHRHGVGAHVLQLGGPGYTLLWMGGEESERTRIDWKYGAVISPRTLEYHQHTNTSPAPVRHLAFRLGDLKGPEDKMPPGYTLWKELEGIAYDEEDPEIYDMFARECARNGATPALPRPSYVGR